MFSFSLFLSSAPSSFSALPPVPSSYAPSDTMGLSPTLSSAARSASVWRSPSALTAADEEECRTFPDTTVRPSKRSQGYHGGTNLATVVRKADRAHIAVGASVVAAHRITSSARNRTVGGIVRPSALAVFRLMTSSNFVGRSTGRSAGFAPFRILST